MTEGIAVPIDVSGGESIIRRTDDAWKSRYDIWIAEWNDYPLHKVTATHPIIGGHYRNELTVRRLYANSHPGFRQPIWVVDHARAAFYGDAACRIS